MYKEHTQINPLLGGKDRHELVAQAATAVRSKVTMLFAVMHIHRRSRIPVHPREWRCGKSNPSPNVSARFIVSGGLLQ